MLLFKTARRLGLHLSIPVPRFSPLANAAEALYRRADAARLTMWWTMDSLASYLASQLYKSSMTRHIANLVRTIRRSSQPASYVMQRYLEGRFMAGADHMEHLLILGQMYDFVAALDPTDCPQELAAFREACVFIGAEFVPGVGMVCLREEEDRYLGAEEMLELLADSIRAGVLHCTD